MSKRVLEFVRLTNNDEEYLDNLACILKISDGDEKQRMKELICRGLDLLVFLLSNNPEIAMLRMEKVRQVPMSIIVLTEGLDNIDWLAKKFKISGSNQTEIRENTILFAVQQIRDMAEKKEEQTGA